MFQITSALNRVRFIRCSILLCFLWLPLRPAHALETTALARDPSTIVKRGDTYWIYGTGAGIRQFSSKDRIHWTERGPVFPTAPAWVATTVPENKGNSVWAPDVRFWNGTYHLYYCYSTLGSNVSGIGMATNATLDPRAWVDQGIIINTGRGENFNALDPCVFQDAAGSWWLSFGSYFSGIKLLKLDNATGKRSMTDTKVYDLATRPNTPPNAIEASYIYYHDGYYYLFVNFDACCAGAKSSYNVRVGRSKTVIGPYLDKGGKAMMEGGGTLFLAAIYDNGQGRLIDDATGPGHVGILHDTDGDWVSTHYEWARDTDATTTFINKLDWDADGWPRVVLDAGPWKIVSNIATHDVLQVVGGATTTGAGLETNAYQNTANQRWTLQYQGAGYYGIIGVGSNKALGSAGCTATPGAKMEISPFRKADCQLWYLQQNDDGTYTLFPKNGNMAQALDVAGCSYKDGAVVEQWNSNGLDCQKWAFRLR